jgi:hypothetical protein
VFNFVRRKASTNPGVGYLVETSETLANWSALELSSALVQSIDSTWERVTITDPVSSAMRFGRVKLVRFDAYRNNFNSALGAASIRGTAVWINQAIQLTDAVQSQLGAVVFDAAYAGPALNGFTARFNMNLGPAGSPVPADGISLSVGDLGAGAWGESGPGTARNLTISFDTYNNGGDGSIGIRIFSNNVAIASNPLNPFTHGVTVPAEITYNATTGVTVKFNGAVVLNQIPLPRLRFPQRQQIWHRRSNGRRRRTRGGGRRGNSHAISRSLGRRSRRAAPTARKQTEEPLPIGVAQLCSGLMNYCTGNGIFQRRG